jgi:hypothetical protein
MNDKRIVSVPVLVATLLLLPSAYLGGYLANSDPVTTDVGLRNAMRDHPEIFGPKQRIPERREHFRFGGDAVRIFFMPLTRLDKTIRPAYWYSD